MRTALVLAVTLLAGCGGFPVPHLSELPARDLSQCRASGLEIGPIDVAFVIDTSMSSSFPSNADIDDNGRIGKDHAGRYTDPGDSLLAAQVAAIKSLLHGAGQLDARFAIVTFGGRTDFGHHEQPQRVVLGADAAIRSELTTDLDALETALDEVLERGSAGRTGFAPAMRVAVRSLAGSPSRWNPVPERAARRRRVVFISDSATPVLAGPNEKTVRHDPPMKYAAMEAIDSQIVFNTIGLGSAAETSKPHMLASIARATGDAYQAVGHADQLHCSLLAALVR